MEKEKISVGQIAALIAILLATGVAAYFFFFYKEEPKSVDAEIIPVSPPADTLDTMKQTAPIHIVEAPKHPKKPRKSGKRDSIKSVVETKAPQSTRRETIRRIEEKVQLKKPQTPAHVPEYIPLVYWASREIGPLDPDRGLDWIEEGLSYKDDAAFYSYGAYLHLIQNRRGKAQAYAEAGSRLRSVLDKKANALGKAVLALIKDSTDQSAKDITRSFQ